MYKDLTNEELVSKYLDNELPEAGRRDFEARLQHDSELQEEFNFQKDIISGIKEVRRLELKGRLDNIPVNMPLYQTTAFKAVAIASITVGMGIGAYYLFEKENKATISETDLSKNQITLTEDSEEIPKIPKAIEPIVPGNKQKEKLQEKPKTLPMAKNTSEEEKDKKEAAQPKVIQPDVIDTFEDEEFKTEEVKVEKSISDMEEIKEGIESTVEIATVKDKRNKFHYKFYNNKLYLLGNFKEMPYEIIELNSKRGKRYFLYYNEHFYKLEKNQMKPAPLVEIENDSLINELKIIQMNK